jgi:hypothetical protein
MVYFIQRGANGPVKIGRAVDVQQRLRTLQTSNPEPLHILLVIAGSSTRESEIHAALVESRMVGRREWFHPTSELFALIERIREPEFEVHGLKAFAVLRRQDPSTPTTPCLFCGERHLHGEGDGHRVPHCRDVTHLMIETPGGITLRHADGYYVRSHGSLGVEGD